jgi:hypothetical protein
MINGALSDAHHTLRSDAENSIVPNLRHVTTAAAINVTRISDWLTGRPREGTRTSPFARLMAPAVAA